MDGHNYRLIIFDWDGTLSDSAAQIVGAMQQTITALDLPVRDDDAIRQLIGLGFEDGLRLLYPDQDPRTLRRMIEDYRQTWVGRVAHGGEPPLFSGALAALETLADAGLPMAVATGKSRAGLRRSLGHHAEVRRLMAASRTADETANKPHPQMLVELLEEFGLQAEQALMVGDTDYDVEMAKAIGMDAVAVTCGAHPVGRLVSAEPTAMLPAVADLPGWLRAG